MTLPPLHPFRQQEVSIIAPSFFPSCIDSLDHFSTQDSSMLGRPASSSVPVSMIYAQTSFPDSPNSLLLQENVRTFLPQQSSGVLESANHQVHQDHLPRQVYVAP